jgi:hypothetical protein
MRYGLENAQDGVDLLTGYSPLPPGAISPVPNWDAIVGIKPGYLKVVGNTIVEKDQAEKDTWDAAHPPTIVEQQEIAQAYIDDTDWYVIREYETGTSIPSDVTTERARQRIVLGG